MKRTLAITTAATLLAISMTACGADRGMPDSGNIAGGTTATDTMHADRMPGTGTTDGATANTRTNNGLNSVTGAVRNGMRDRNDSVYGVGGPNSGAYTSMNNGGITGMRTYESDADVARAAAEGDRYARMLENARVHDRDGFILDGENTSYDTL